VWGARRRNLPRVLRSVAGDLRLVRGRGRVRVGVRVRLGVRVGVK